jgi:hypothetical protein
MPAKTSRRRRIEAFTDGMKTVPAGYGRSSPFIGRMARAPSIRLYTPVPNVIEST